MSTPTNPRPQKPPPEEFKNRLDEWEWLCEHFDSSAFKVKSGKAKAAREQVKTKQRGGSCSIRDHEAAILAAKEAELDESLRKVREPISGFMPPQPNSDETRPSST